MKSERRHELQHNMLADWLAETIDAIRPYTYAVVGVALVIVASVIFVIAYRAHNAEQLAEAWDGMPGPVSGAQGQFQPLVPPSLMMSTKPLEEVITNFPDTSAAQWASLFVAERYLIEGSTQAARDDSGKKLYMQALTEALKKYEAILKTDGLSQWIIERAMFGKARTQEQMANVDAALTSYQDLVRDYPKSGFKELADQRIEDLQVPDVKQFYDLYRTSAPKKSSPAKEIKELGSELGLPSNPPEEKGLPAIPVPSTSLPSTSGAAPSGPSPSGSAGSGLPSGSGAMTVSPSGTINPTTSGAMVPAVSTSGAKIPSGSVSSGSAAGILGPSDTSAAPAKSSSVAPATPALPGPAASGSGSAK
jgi:hypothetical protein